MNNTIKSPKSVTTQIIARLKVEGIHRWAMCPIEEVRFLRYYHRHLFFITAYKQVNHDNRDIEFIQLSHQIQQYLTIKYFDPTYNCLFFDDMSCEMIATELLHEFDLCEVEVSEDGEGGSRVRSS